MDDQQIEDILKRNEKRPFVKRILNKDNYEPLYNEDGSVSTHSMAYAEADGKYYVYPTVLMTEDGLKRFSPDEAWKHAYPSYNAIEFDSEEDAAAFSENYKRKWADDFLK